MESEGKKVRSGGGFGGTGFKFDEAEAQYTTEKKKYQKAAFGLQVIDPAQIQLGIHRISEPDNRSDFFTDPADILYLKSPDIQSHSICSRI